MECGEGLEYLDRAVQLRCTGCGRVENGHIRCPRGHYLCESCHNRKAVEVIKAFCLSTRSRSPFEIATELMDHPGIPMLGCHHAFIASGAIMAALRNEGTLRIEHSQIEEAFIRTERQAVSGYCGLTGVCGIAPAIGACIAIILGSRCGTDIQQRLTMGVVSEVCRAITDLTGPGCCKAYLRASVEIAVQFLLRRLRIRLPAGGFQQGCQHADRHPHGCRRDQCPYFGVSNG